MIDIRDLDHCDIIAWYRAKSREYAEIAAKLARDHGVHPTDLSDSDRSPLQPILDYLKDVGAKRPADIADFVKSTKEAVLATIATNSDTLIRGKRGWIKLKN